MRVPTKPWPYGPEFTSEASHRQTSTNHVKTQYTTIYQKSNGILCTCESAYHRLYAAGSADACQTRKRVGRWPLIGLKTLYHSDFDKVFLLYT